MKVRILTRKIIASSNKMKIKTFIKINEVKGTFLSKLDYKHETI